jgi:DNA-binding MarR family transcriptional regulator
MIAGSRHGPPLIGALLRMPWESVHERMLAGLRERGFTDLGASHLSVLQWPGPDDLRPSELAAQIRMSKQALNYLLGQLELMGYLQRHDDARDQRFKRIALTDRGQRAARAMRDVVQEVETEWQQQLGAERFAQLRALLTDLNNHVAADRRQTNSDQQRVTRGIG